MTPQKPRSLGLLILDRGLPLGAPYPNPKPGTMRHTATFDFPVISEIVPGALADKIIRGDPALDSAFTAAAQRLVERGAVALSSDCGFSVRHHAAVAASVHVPVAMSSLLLLPSLLRQFPPPAKIAIVTADSRHCDQELLRIGDSAEQARIVIGGIENGTFLHNERTVPVVPTNIADIVTDVATCVAQLRSAHPEIRALLFECAAFPLASPEIRRSTGLPVYDITDLCRLTMASIA